MSSIIENSNINNDIDIDDNENNNIINENDTNSNSQYYHRCGRMLPINNISNLNDLQQLCHMICNNILQHPNDIKYQQLKLSNKLIQTRLLTRKGGIEFLHAIGFEIQTHDFQKVLVLKNNENNYIDNIRNGLIWLDETIHTCVKMAQSHHKQNDSDKSCAECIIQVKISKGLNVTGGFMANDKLDSVLQFVKCFFKIEKNNNVCLRLPHMNKAYDDDCMIKTLEELELYPRSILIASTLSDEQVAEKMIQVKQNANEDIKRNIANAEQIRREKIKKNENDSNHKKNLLLAFNDDRKDYKERRHILSKTLTEENESNEKSGV